MSKSVILNINFYPVKKTFNIKCTKENYNVQLHK